MENKICKCPGCGYLMAQTDKVCKYCGSNNSNYTAPKFDTQFLRDMGQKASKALEPVTSSFNILIFIVLLIFFWPAAIIYFFIANKKK